MKYIARIGLVLAAAYLTLTAGCARFNYRETPKAQRSKVASRLEKSIHLAKTPPEVGENENAHTIAWDILKREIEPVQKEANELLNELDELEKEAPELFYFSK